MFYYMVYSKQFPERLKTKKMYTTNLSINLGPSSRNFVISADKVVDILCWLVPFNLMEKKTWKKIGIEFISTLAKFTIQSKYSMKYR